MPACRKSFEIELPNHPKPVVNCLIHPDSLWKLNLVWSSSPTGEYVFANIGDAQVEMKWPAGGVFLNSYVDGKTSYYSHPDQKVPSLENTGISLIINIGDTVITSTTRIPPKPHIELTVNTLKVKTYTDPVSGEIYGYGVDGNADLKIIRPATGQRYYTLSASYRLYTMYGSDPYSGVREVFSDDLYVRTDDRRCLASMTKDEGYLVDLGPDEPATAEFFINIDGGIAYPYEPFEYFVISVNSITEEYYQYSKKIRDQYVSSLDPFGEPVRIPSNIEGGVGIFSGYNSCTVEVKVGR